jgi:hypothetical protein
MPPRKKSAMALAKERISELEEQIAERNKDLGKSAILSCLTSDTFEFSQG